MSKGYLCVICALALAGAGLLIWCLQPSGEHDRAQQGEELLSRRKIAQGKPALPRKARRDRAAEKIKSAPVRPNVSLDSEDEASLTGEMKRLFAELQAALDVENKEKVFSLVDKMQAMDEWPDDIPLSVKMKALEALKWFGADGIPAVVGFAADGNPQVQQETVDALLEMLSDASLGDRATSEIVKQLVKVVTAEDALDSLMMELNDMRNSVRVDTARAVYGSGNETAIKVLDENVEFLFCDGDVEVKGRGDLDAYEKANPDDPEDDENYGPPKE